MGLHVDRQGDISLHVNNTEEEGNERVDQQDRCALELGDPFPNGHVRSVMRFGRARFADAEEDDEAKSRSGQRVCHEEDEEVVIRDQSRQKRRDRRPHVDRPVVVPIGACSRFRRDKVRNCRADRRTVEICKKPNQKGRYGNQCKITRQPEGDHKDRRDEETHQHHGATPQTIGELSAAQLRNKGARAKERNHQRRLADGDVPPGGQVQRQKGDDETAETVD